MHGTGHGRTGQGSTGQGSAGCFSPVKRQVNDGSGAYHGGAGAGDGSDVSQKPRHPIAYVPHINIGRVAGPL